MLKVECDKFITIKLDNSPQNSKLAKMKGKNKKI